MRTRGENIVNPAQKRFPVCSESLSLEQSTNMQHDVSHGEKLSLTVDTERFSRTTGIQR